MNATIYIITKAMMQLGFMPDYNGFMYLRSAVYIAMKDPEAITLVTKLIYAPLAKEYETTALNIEKSIRKAAESVWKNNELSGKTVNVLNGTYTYPETRPENRELIALLMRFVKESGEIFDTDIREGI